MRILGIDCGSEKTGYGVIETDGRKHRLLISGVIKTSARDALDARLLTIASGLREVIVFHRPEAAAVEEVFFGQNVKTLLKLAHVRGVALLVISEAGIALGEYSPLEVKMSVVGFGRAEKQQVQLMVKSLLGLKEIIASEDASDAVAVAICHATRTMSSLSQSKPKVAQPASEPRPKKAVNGLPEGTTAEEPNSK